MSSPTYKGTLVTRDAVQTIPNTTWTAVIFNSEIHDTDAFHDNSTNPTRITVPADSAGYYHIYGQIQWESNATGVRWLELRLNGTAIMRIENSAYATTSAHGMWISIVYSMSVTDYVELFVYQSSGGNLDVERAASYTPLFGADLIGV